MKPFVVIRKLEGADNLQCQTVVKDFVMAGAWDAFVSCLFREVSVNNLFFIDFYFSLIDLRFVGLLFGGWTDYAAAGGHRVGDHVYLLWDSAADVLRGHTDRGRFDTVYDLRELLQQGEWAGYSGREQAVLGGGDVRATGV